MIFVELFSLNLPSFSYFSSYFFGGCWFILQIYFVNFVFFCLFLITLFLANLYIMKFKFYLEKAFHNEKPSFVQIGQL